jgi:hypothetical protein
MLKDVKRLSVYRLERRNRPRKRAIAGVQSASIRALHISPSSCALLNTGEPGAPVFLEIQE